MNMAEAKKLVRVKTLCLGLIGILAQDDLEVYDLLVCDPSGRVAAIEDLFFRYLFDVAGLDLQLVVEAELYWKALRAFCWNLDEPDKALCLHIKAYRIVAEDALTALYDNLVDILEEALAEDGEEA